MSVTVCLVDRRYRAPVIFTPKPSIQEAIDSLVSYFEDCKKYGRVEPKTITFEILE